MRIVTRPDFDGIVCAALLFEAERITQPTYWVEPGVIQRKQAVILPNDIIANLPYDPRCAMWFDHHYTNCPRHDFKGLYRIAPSAAGLIYEYYNKNLNGRFDRLIRQTNDIDSANLTLEQVRFPENYPYLLLSMTISSRNSEETSYWNHLTRLLRNHSITDVMSDTQVKAKCRHTIQANSAFELLLQQHTQVLQGVAVSDFRSFEKAPEGNRFLVYALFPQAVVAVKIRLAHDDPQKVIVSVGHSIFNRNCRINVGKLLSRFGGGGHAGAGAATFHSKDAKIVIPQIIRTLKKNEPNTS